MSAELAQHIRTLAEDGVKIHIWPRKGGGFQANVSEPGSDGWTIHSGDDPVSALLAALRLRVGRIADRPVQIIDEPPVPDVSSETDPRQIDIEDVLDDPGCIVCENGGCDADPMEGMFG